ncbi:putative NADPH-dependent methylglyoxal reductase GRP2 [Rhexocercosporidium sp. MPI-PUGE-AT-0058]|nr:putative NADPH-dependent methylglyoxal reductase GRP2 [Rhexocercosporidium sp. MPI-PUGE-AT-0058]
MSRVLLTGGSGFIASQMIGILLDHEHSVVATVRSQSKVSKLQTLYPNVPISKLDFVIVEDVGKEGAFDHAVVSEPPFEVVIHTASPFYFNVKDIKSELLDPALHGTTSILKAIKEHAPTVKKVVITSSIASIVDSIKPNDPKQIYSEADWNPVSYEAALKDVRNGYRGSKVFAEKAAWKFMEDERPNFTLATICPPLVVGPITSCIDDISKLNTSNIRFFEFITGKYKGPVIPETGNYLWADVRDVALAHVRAFEVDEAAGKRFFTVASHFCNKEIVDILRKNFPEFEDKLPDKEASGGGYPEEGPYGFSNENSTKVLGIEFMGFEKSVVDLVKSLQVIGV